MTIDELRKLDAPLLTRALAEVICGWELRHPRKGDKEYDDKNYGMPTCSFEMYRNKSGESVSSERIFHPLTSIDDAVMCVEKLDEEKKEKWIRNLYSLVVDYGSSPYKADFLLANASAELRILALLNTVPDVMVQYNELAGGGR